MSLFTGVEGFEEHEKAYLSIKPKRIHYDTPTYLKFYTIYQYDRIKFRELMNAWLETEEGKDENRTLFILDKKQKEILEICYIRDKEGEKLRDCDENHIFRYKTLWNIQNKIYTEILFKRMRNLMLNGDEVILNYDELQAELKDTWNMSIKDRVKAHIKLLRRLRKENV